jgi:hypothetical protein
VRAPERLFENALEVHGEIRDVGLCYVGFKDIGLPFDRLKALTEVIHESGQEVMLEVVSEGKRDELRSAQASLDYYTEIKNVYISTEEH